MRVAGIDLPAGAVAELALRLHNAGANDLAQRVGTAVDTNRPTLGFSSRERSIVLLVLDDCPERLAPLRAVLTQDQLARESGGR
jgi:hypothetical protein